jgi:hypothetical protein
MSLEGEQYINSVRRGLIARGFTGMKYDEAYRLLINSYKTPSANLDSVFANSEKQLQSNLKGAFKAMGLDE